ncbi:serine hydrolase domain-containing protein [Streptomyces sp. NPDC015220]|uniref:serine hydrolase domain-containing protein n=1 Tax=Streptomyces sp. NPDC015220 TaxID=3364947 RepID=UPI0036FA82C4
MRILRSAGTAVATALLLTAAAPVASAGTATAAPAASTAAPDPAALRTALRAVTDAGMYGVYSSVRDGARSWSGASGVADVDTGRPVRPDMRQRVGSISKTFTAVAVLQQVERGRIRLDAPIGDYLPDLIPGQRGRQITVRMLLNHTSGIGDYVIGAFPSLAQGSTASLDEERFRSVRPEELVRLGLAAPATGAPGALPGHYSNTNYVIAGLLLAEVTGQDPETYITRHVIDRAGLHHTSYPRTPHIQGPHPRMYESFYGLIDPPRDYSVYDMSWAYTAGAVVSTADDLNRFYRALLTGRLLGPAALKQMQTTVPVDGMAYGLGIYAVDIPGCGRFWGHDGAVFGAGTIALSSPDGRRQVAAGWNLMKYERLNADGTGFEPSPIDDALNSYIGGALCSSSTSPAVPRSLTKTPVPAVLPGIDSAPGAWTSALR